MEKLLRNEDRDKKKYENSKVKDLAVHAEKFLYYEEVILGKSYNTVRSYRRDIYQFIDYLNEYEEITKFDEVETITVRSFIAYLNSGDKSRQLSTESGGEKKEKPVNPVSKRSINRKISALRTFFKYLQEKQIVKINKISYIAMPKFEKELPNILNKEDLNKLRDVINTGKITGVRDRLIIEMLYSSGMRASELIDLSEYMINIPEREIRVIGKGDKERITFFSETARKWLEKYLSDKRKEYGNYSKETVFTNNRGEKLTTRSLRRLISNYGKEAGIQKEITPHVFRHSFATELLNNGVDIRYLQELLGHSSISTTQVYTHVSKALLKDIYMKTHPLAKE